MKIQIKYSKEDEGYVAKLEGLEKGRRWQLLAGFGHTEEEALIEFTEAVKEAEEIYRNKPWDEKLIHHLDPVAHFAWRDIKLHAPPEEFNKLCEWMVGQTMIQRDDGDTGVYVWDFERWLHQGRKTAQGADWD